jgi:hypothetical protein
MAKPGRGYGGWRLDAGDILKAKGGNIVAPNWNVFLPLISDELPGKHGLGKLKTRAPSQAALKGKEQLVISSRWVL